MSEGGMAELDILGGEPTLHPELESFIDEALSAGLSISMSTNGSRVPVLEALYERHSGRALTIGISINDRPVEPELHEHIVVRRPLLKSVCTRHHFIPQAAEPYLYMKDIKYYLIFMDTPFAEDLKAGLPFYDFFKRLNAVKEKHGNVEGVFCGGFIPGTTQNNLRCPAGTTKLTVMPDGSIYPCYLLSRHKEFKLGNVLHDKPEVIQRHPSLDFFRNFAGNRCPDTKCELHDRCHGGCPAMALLTYGDPAGPDPRCA